MKSIFLHSPPTHFPEKVKTSVLYKSFLGIMCIVAFLCLLLTFLSDFSLEVLFSDFLKIDIPRKTRSADNKVDIYYIYLYTYLYWRATIF